MKYILGSILLIGLAGCNNNTTNMNVSSTNNSNDITNIDSTSINECNNKPQLLVSQKNRNIYTYCLENIKINTDNQSFNLKEYIETNDKAIDKIINTLEFVDSFDDGGTNIYKSNNITLIKCNTLDGNKDIYIGNENMRFKENFCKNNNYTFVRTYKIKSIKECKEQQYENGIPVTYGKSSKVELSQFQAESETVIINNLWDVPLEENKTYEFKFILYNDSLDIEDNIQYIFKNSNIIEVRETNKVVLEQLQEEIK